MKKLSNSERKNLRSQAHPLKPVVMIGQSGLTEAVLAEIDIALNAHVLIKISIRGTDKKELDKQFLSLSEEEKVVAIDLFESLKVVMEEMLKKQKTHH